ncbi:MATE family efflux transporter [Fusibacillus kribbianus]|uniref:Multidrug export protein MepA n=1 Tax=Fusibacillus kribbianus TaxID=3044208 RepID=A0AAP4EYV2_9FIRM|nr:MATE family efflux transporter [Ruminococcus sp. YH-rum2234]MDI9242261.1 MATE family efflux transporter [Ruminococcus sp. YH-rum2234]
MRQEENKSDFSKGSVYRHITSLAVPLTIAQLVQMLYNIVDRIYIGHLPGASSLALTGLGLTFPVITLILAFTNLFGMGGTPLFSIARGRRQEERAGKIMGNTFTLLCISCILLMAVSYGFLRPLLYLFGASDESYPFAWQYLRIYLIGTPFAMLATGMNGFINAQGFARTGMLTVLIGAVTNIILDPVFIYVLDMGVSGAALATVISQCLSAVWVLRFLTGKKTLYSIRKCYLKPEAKLVREILGLGTAGFVVSASNGAVQIACNATLRSFGGDIYVGIMTVLNSVRDVVSLPIQGVTHASQPVMGFNFGAGEYGRIKKAIAFVTAIGVSYMLAAWLLLFLFPEPIMRIFNSDPELITKGIPSLHLYFFGFFMMAFQFVGQSTFVGLGMSKHSIFFSLFRKIIIVVPLTLILPHLAGMGVQGVFLAEPISNFIGGTASFTTMLFTVRRLFRNGGEKGKTI